MHSYSDTNHLRTGAMGEQVAANFLQSKGYLILTMNFTNTTGKRIGEIDIIARDLQKDELVFVEVKTRDYEHYAHSLPEENITHAKLRKLTKIAMLYLRKMHWEDQAYRFDAISVWLNWKTRRAKIKHLPNIYLG